MLTDNQILDAIKKRREEVGGIFMFNFIPMTFEQAEELLWGKPWDQYDPPGLSYWIGGKSNV